MGHSLSSTVGLAMIVKDEAPVIRRCLEAARPRLSHWTIIDTGSTDGTQDIIRDALKGIPGKLHKRGFVNFGTTRSELMRLAAGTADYLLLLDADMTVHWPPPIFELTADVYEAEIRFRGLAYALPLLVKGDRPWCYRGVAHSYLAVSDDQPFTQIPLPGLWVHDDSHTTVAKLERDLGLLSVELARNPLDARTAFYLAQTYFDLDRIPEAIAAYRYRANLDGWDEETFFARYRLGTLLVEYVSFAEGARELLAAWEMRPQRVEPLRALGRSAMNVADKIPVPDDRLFVTPDAYARQPLTPDKVSAVIVTRGDHPDAVADIIAGLPYSDVVVWDNSDPAREDLKTLGRYRAMDECRNDIVFMVDDDVEFTAHEQLLAAYEPGVAVCNMDDAWVQACGYDDLGQFGAGSIADRALFAPAIESYLSRYPDDAFFRMESDFVLGTLVPHRKIDIGYTAREFADDPDRLYTTPGQPTAKQLMRERCRAIRDGRPAPAEAADAIPEFVRS